MAFVDADGLVHTDEDEEYVDGEENDLEEYTEDEEIDGDEEYSEEEDGMIEEGMMLRWYRNTPDRATTPDFMSRLQFYIHSRIFSVVSHTPARMDLASCWHRAVPVGPVYHTVR